MINFLPIKSIREEDKDLFGDHIVKLARLSHHNLPVEEGLAVSPPKEIILDIFEDLKIWSKEEFEVNRQKFETKFFEIPRSEGFSGALSEKRIDSAQVWKNILKVWLNMIESKIHREGFNKKKILELPGQVVFFATEIKSSGKAFYDRFKKEVLVKMEEGELEFEDGIKLDRVVIEAEKILHLPYVYNFIVDRGEVKITRLSPFTEKTIFESEVQVLNPKPKQQLKVNLNKRAVKLFIQIEKGFVANPDVDGFITGGDNSEDFDQRAFRLSEIAASFQAHPVIFSFGEVAEDQDGSFRDSLEEEARVFLFARHKKRLLNTQVALPSVNSIEKFMQIKRDLSSLGIIRKASLKFWMRAAIPENLIQIENYITGGFDGIIIDLDGLTKNLTGDERIKMSLGIIEMIKRFIEEPLKILHKERIPVILAGKTLMDHQLLEHLVNSGIYGIVIDGDESYSVREGIKGLESGHQNLIS